MRYSYTSTKASTGGAETRICNDVADKSMYTVEGSEALKEVTRVGVSKKHQECMLRR